VYPVLGFFNKPGGGTAIGIVPLNDPTFNQFRSAVTNVSLSDFIIKDTDPDAITTVDSVAADLFQIELNPGTKINAVVLSGVVSSCESQVSNISYHVSVLERLTGNPPPQAPILIVPGGWTGKYNLDASGALGPLLRSGIPQN
jgi:hypothetical protein